MGVGIIYSIIKKYAGGEQKLFGVYNKIGFGGGGDYRKEIPHQSKSVYKKTLQKALNKLWIFLKIF